MNTKEAWNCPLAKFLSSLFFLIQYEESNSLTNLISSQRWEEILRSVQIKSQAVSPDSREILPIWQSLTVFGQFFVWYI